MSDEHTTGVRPFRKLREKIQIISVASRAVKDGTLHSGITEEEMVDVISLGMIAEDPETYLAAGFDWQAVLELFVKLLPFIMKMFGL